jgi:hypothetical protein
MNWTYGDFWLRSRKWLKAGWLTTAGLIAVYISVIEPRQMAKEISASGQTGLAAYAGGSILPWRQNIAPESIAGQAMLLQTRVATDNFAPPPPPPPGESTIDRKLISTAAIDMIVKQPDFSAEEVRKLAEASGGFLVSSQISGEQNGRYATLTIRVPVTRFTEVKAGILKLGLRMESDRIEAQDVTKEYVDQQAQLRNLRAQEQQYLSILKRATTVKDTLEVSQELNRVRGEIEQKQAEFVALAKQTETVAIALTLRADADAQVFGIRWRPLYELKIAARNGLAGIVDYITAMVSLLFFLPTILLWLATILVGAAIAWRIFRWVARFFFVSSKTVLTEKGAI